MKKNIYHLGCILVLVLFLFFMLIFSKDTLASAHLAFTIWRDTVFPSLFPFFLICDLLIQYGLVDLLGELTKKIMNRLFYLPGEASFVLIGSMISGFPSSAKYINELLERNHITQENAQYLLSFTHFSNPLFVIGVLGSQMLSNQKTGFLILLCHIMSNFIMALLIRKKQTFPTTSISLRRIWKKVTKKTEKLSFISVLTSSIIKSLQTLILLLGIITTFLIISTLLTTIIPLNDFSKAIFGGILEMTQGIQKVSLLSISLRLKSSVMAMLISFGGISIHLQVMSILNKWPIRYRDYLLSRITHALLAGLLVFFTFPIFC